MTRKGQVSQMFKANSTPRQSFRRSVGLPLPYCVDHAASAQLQCFLWIITTCPCTCLCALGCRVHHHTRFYKMYIFPEEETKARERGRHRRSWTLLKSSIPSIGCLPSCYILTAMACRTSHIAGAVLQCMHLPFHFMSRC